MTDLALFDGSVISDDLSILNLGQSEKDLVIAEHGLNPEQADAYLAVKRGKNIFLTGEAGCGKSFLINTIKKTMKNVAVTAMTGVAALLIGGTTLHSWAGIGKGDGGLETLIAKAKRFKPVWINWKTTKVLIIDEVSMMDLTLFEKIVYMIQYFRPEGGLQLVLCGDMMQLPPVKKIHFCFQSYLWDSVINEEIELTTNMRQQDPVFAAHLSELRMGRMSKECVKALRDRQITPPDDVVPTRLYSTRNDTDAINALQLAKLGNPTVEFKPTISIIGEVKEHILNLIKDKDPFAKPVSLAVGAQVLMMKNDPEIGLVNGSKGVVKSIDQDVVVSFYNGVETTIGEADKEIEVEKGLICIKRIPLMLGWAITTHKSQGMTLEHTQVDIGSSVFADGQMYTALSRVKSLDNLYILDFDPMKLKCNQKAKAFYDHIRGKKDAKPLDVQKSTILDCWLCLDRLKKPVTLGCGHNVCKKCWSLVEDKKCGVCRAVQKTEPKINVQLSDLADLLK